MFVCEMGVVCGRRCFSGKGMLLGRGVLGSKRGI